MPNRILRDYTDSTHTDAIDVDAERLYVRLIMKVDDFGRFHATPSLVRAACFPLKANFRVTDISRLLKELSQAGLIALYEVRGRSYLAIVNFKQRKRLGESKFPTRPGEDPLWLPDFDSQMTVIRQQAAALVGDGDGDGDDITRKPAAVALGVVLPAKLKTPEFELMWEQWKVFRMSLTGTKPKSWDTVWKLHIGMLEVHPVATAIAMLQQAMTRVWKAPFPLTEGTQGTFVKPKGKTIEDVLNKETERELKNFFK